MTPKEQALEDFKEYCRMTTLLAQSIMGSSLPDEIEKIWDLCLLSAFESGYDVVDKSRKAVKFEVQLDTLQSAFEMGLTRAFQQGQFDPRNN